MTKKKLLEIIKGVPDDATIWTQEDEELGLQEYPVGAIEVKDRIFDDGSHKFSIIFSPIYITNPKENE